MSENYVLILISHKNGEICTNRSALARMFDANSSEGGWVLVSPTGETVQLNNSFRLGVLLG